MLLTLDAAGMDDPKVSSPAVHTSQPAAESSLPAMPSEEETRPAPAGFGRRLGARVIDCLVIAYGITLTAFAVLLTDRDCSVLSCQAWEAIFFVVSFLAVAGYEILLTASRGKTLGKRAVGIGVVRADDDAPPSYGRAALRFLVLFVLIAVWPLFLVSFIAALSNPRKQMWHDRAGRTIVVRRARGRQGRRWLRVAAVTAVVAASLGFGGYLVDQALPNELIMVDFGDGVDPFNLGESSGARFEHVGGTYRVTIKNTDFRLNTSVGEFARTAFAVGIRVEVVEMTRRGTSVGAMCLGPASEGDDELVGYGFFVEPGGDFRLEREDSGGRLETLKQGTDAKVETVERVSIMCVPDLDGDVTLIGFANGLEVAVAEDPDGHHVYTYAGLSVEAEQAGAEVRFTRVLARVPDEEWVA